MKKILFVIAALALFVGCSKEYTYGELAVEFWVAPSKEVEIYTPESYENDFEVATIDINSSRKSGSVELLEGTYYIVANNNRTAVQVRNGCKTTVRYKSDRYDESSVEIEEF